MKKRIMLLLLMQSALLLSTVSALGDGPACPPYCQVSGDSCINCDIASADPADLSPDDLQYLNDAQKAQFWSKITSYDGFDEPTIRQNMKYITWGDQRLLTWMRNNRPLPNQFWSDANNFDGDKTDSDMWRLMMDDESIDAWMENYQFGDILKFFGGLSFGITFL